MFIFNRHPATCEQPGMPQHKFIDYQEPLSTLREEKIDIKLNQHTVYQLV